MSNAAGDTVTVTSANGALTAVGTVGTACNNAGTVANLLVVRDINGRTVAEIFNGLALNGVTVVAAPGAALVAGWVGAA